MSRLGPALLGFALLTSAASLSACGNDTTAGSTTAQADSVAATDLWVKAVDSGMTAAFGVLTDDGPVAATLVSASTDVSPMVEIHEVVMKDGEMVMQPKEGGIVIPAGGSVTLEPGGDHIMLMDVAAPIEPGDEVALTLTFADGSTLDVSATAKTYSGGNEQYQSGDMGDMGSTDSPGG